MHDVYTYYAVVTEVYDGDTITCDIDLGFHIWIHDQKFRLARIDTPEIRGVEREKGLFVRDLVREKILGNNVILKTIKDSKDKYGRWLAEVYYEDENINQWLLNEGYAKLYE